MVTRQTVTTGELSLEQAITREEALRLWTHNSAYTTDWEYGPGSIQPDKRADLVVLDASFSNVRLIRSTRSV
jgi:predicted amidohydrolase YtcJ